MPRTVYNLDSAELSTAAATLGIPHAPGYPLYVLIGHLFTRIPLGDVGFRMNLMSGVFGGIALVLLFSIVHHLTSSRASAVFAAWLLGFSYPFWSDAIVAEVYTLDVALVLATLLCCLRWQTHKRTPDLLLIGLLFGLSLANRTTNILSAPALVLFLLPDLRRHWPRICASAAAVLPGLSLYLLLPLRSASSHAYRWGSGYDLSAVPDRRDLTDPASLWWYVSARVFRGFAEAYTWDDRAREAMDFAADLWLAYLGGGALLAAAGAAILLLTQRRVAALLLIVAVPHTLFYVNYAVPDKDTMFLTSYAVLAILAGVGVGAASKLLAQHNVRGAPSVLLAATCLFAAGLVVVNAPLVNVSGDQRARERGEALFASADRGAVVVGSWTDIAPLEYLQLVEGRRSDLALVQDWALHPASPQALIEHNVRNGRAVYVGYQVELPAEFEVVPFGAWYQVTLAPEVTKEVP